MSLKYEPSSVPLHISVCEPSIRALFSTEAPQAARLPPEGAQGVVAGLTFESKVE